MNYRKIDQRVQQLTPNEALTYFCLSLKSDFYSNVSHIKQDSLLEFVAKQGGTKSIDTIKRHIKRFEEVGLVETETVRIQGKFGWFNRNTYKLSTENYKMLDSSLLDLEVDGKTKGFLVILWVSSYNFTDYFMYTNKELSEITMVGKNSIPVFLKTLLNKEILVKSKEVGEKAKHHFTDSKIFIPSRKSLGQTMIEVYGCALSDEELDAYKIVS